MRVRVGVRVGIGLRPSLQPLTRVRVGVRLRPSLQPLDQLAQHDEAVAIHVPTEEEVGQPLAPLGRVRVRVRAR